jgi:ABC-type polysaccharide/polyol phosphate export permease
MNNRAKVGSQAGEALHPPGRHSLVGAGEILRALVIKELKVKYKRSILGFLWSLVTPVALVAVYLFVFGQIYRVGPDDFGLFLLSGLLPWHYFNMGLVAATNSLVDNAPLIRKVYFPRILIPVSSVVANLVTFLVGLGMLSIVAVLSGRSVWPHLHWLILAVGLETALCAGAAMALSIWNVYLRDIRQLISILLLVLFFMTPIVYELSFVPARFRPLLSLNPLSAIMAAYRSALFYGSDPDLGLVGIGAAVTLLILGFGWAVFRRQSPLLAKEV